MQPLSISIVAFHDYDDIKKAITSIVQYTSIPYEMYVFDNSVEDPQKEEFQTFLQVNHVHYVDNHENQGFGKGHNHALEYIDSKYPAIINTDIVDPRRCVWIHLSISRSSSRSRHGHSQDRG